MQLVHSEYSRYGAKLGLKARPPSTHVLKDVLGQILYVL